MTYEANISPMAVVAYETVSVHIVVVVTAFGVA